MRVGKGLTPPTPPLLPACTLWHAYACMYACALLLPLRACARSRSFAAHALSQAHPVALASSWARTWATGKGQLCVSSFAVSRSSCMCTCAVARTGADALPFAAGTQVSYSSAAPSISVAVCSPPRRVWARASAVAAKVRGSGMYGASCSPVYAAQSTTGYCAATLYLWMTTLTYSTRSEHSRSMLWAEVRASASHVRYVNEELSPSDVSIRPLSIPCAIASANSSPHSLTTSSIGRCSSIGRPTRPTTAS